MGRWVLQNDEADVLLTIDVTNESKARDIFRNLDIARVLQSLWKHGATQGIYKFFSGRAIVDALHKHGGVMATSNMEENPTHSTCPSPISVLYENKG